MKKKTKVIDIATANKNDPTLPETVLFGLTFINLGPLKILPVKIPPMSEKMQINKRMNTKIFNFEITTK